MNYIRDIVFVVAIAILPFAIAFGSLSNISYAQTGNEVEAARQGTDTVNSTGQQSSESSFARQGTDEIPANTDQQAPVEAARQGTDTVNSTEQAEDITLEAQQKVIQKAAGVDAVQKIDQVATQIASSSTEAQATGDVEEAGASTIEQIIQQIAVQTGRVGGNVNQIVNQLSQQIANNPTGPLARSIQQLAQQYGGGNTDEVEQGTALIGRQIAEGKNIQQTIVQVSNQVINNINNINTNINNYNNVNILSSSPTETKIIQETVNTLKAEKQTVEVPRIDIQFANNKERHLSMRVLNTINAKYDMPFSRYNGAFIMDDHEFKVKVIGKGKIISAAVSEMKKNGDLGPRDFLGREIRNGKIFFGLDEVKQGKYLLDIYVRLSNGSIGTYSRGSMIIP